MEQVSVKKSKQARLIVFLLGTMVLIGLWLCKVFHLYEVCAVWMFFAPISLLTSPKMSLMTTLGWIAFLGIAQASPIIEYSSPLELVNTWWPVQMSKVVSTAIWILNTVLYVLMSLSPILLLIIWGVLYNRRRWKKSRRR